MSSWTSRRASEHNVSFFDHPHPEQLSPPDRRDITPWQPFVGAGMSSTNLNNEDYFSDHPKRLPSLDALFRAQAQLSPEYFLRILERQSGDNHCSQDDYQRALFLFRRLQSARQTISQLSFFLVPMSLVPFVCVALPEEWRLSVFTSAIVSEVFAGVILCFAHSRWQARRRDYCLWLRLIYRRVSDL
jgi:hypothetical protein